MGEPRKVFRIEEIAATRRPTQAEDTIPLPGYAEIMRELSALRALIRPSRHSLLPEDRGAPTSSASLRLSL